MTDTSELTNERTPIAAADAPEPPYPDGVILDAYLDDRCKFRHAAFADLVARHGPMVRGVCRRVLGDVPDVDDAFQAVFLVLMRKAHTIWPRDRVGAWLHGVARRVAFKAKGLAARRNQREQPLGDYSIDGPPEPRDWLPLLDRELGMLPEKYRSAIVLCDLEGQSRRDAAACLRLSEGTLSSRLARGRALLGDRLKRKGVVLSAALAAFANSANAATPPALVLNTTTAVLAGQTTGVPALLCQGVMKAMLVNKLMNSLAAVLVVLSFAFGAGTGAYLLNAADKPAKPANPANAAEKPVKPNAGEMASGVVKSIDATQKTITLLVPNPGTKETKEETYTLGKEVEVTLAHGVFKETKAGKLEDVTPGSRVHVRLSADKKSAVGVVVQPGTINGSLKAFDAAKRVATVNMKDTKEKIEKAIEIAADAKVYIDDGIGNKGDAPKEGNLADLAEGIMVNIQLAGYDRNKGVAVRVSGPTVQGTVEGVDVGNNSITIGSKSEGSQTFPVSKDVRVNKNGKLADVTNGAGVSLRLAVGDKKTVVGIQVKE